MFDSGISAVDLIKELKNEVDVAYEIPDGSYIFWLSSLEQLLYSEIIKEQNKIIIVEPPEDKIIIASVFTPFGESPFRFEDIHTIYADGVQLIKSTVTSGVIFPNTYYKTGVDIGYNVRNAKNPLYKVSEIVIIYFARPEIKTGINAGNLNVMIPYEFIDLIKAKLRGEAYKLCNEDIVAAKWLGDYNALLESFKVWILNRKEKLGM